MRPTLVYQVERERELRVRLNAIAANLRLAQRELVDWRKELRAACCDDLRVELAIEWREAIR